MGCDIHIFAEKRNLQTGKWEKIQEDLFTLDNYDKKMYGKDKGDLPFNWRCYSMFAFLAGVRNYDCCDPISKPKGLPIDSEYLNELQNHYTYDLCPRMDILMGRGYFSFSYLTVKELLDFNYDKEFWNRRITRQESSNSFNGAALAMEGEGKLISYRDNLGEAFFVHLKELEQIGDPVDTRIVFWFDN